MNQTLIKNNPSMKLGRNSACSCNSGKKYKKCCLNNTNSAERNHSLKQASMNRLKDKHSNGPSLLVDAEKMGVTKMSEIILDFAHELLHLASTSDEKEKTIFIAISTWNMALLDEEERPEKIDSFLYNVMNLRKDSTDWNEARSIIENLIDKKLEEYPSVDRFIIDYEFIQLNPRDFHLNVVSSLVMD